MSADKRRFIEQERQRAAKLREDGHVETAGVIERLADRFGRFLDGATVIEPIERSNNQAAEWNRPYTRKEKVLGCISIILFGPILWALVFLFGVNLW